MDAAGVNTFVVLVGDDTQVSVLHDDVAWDGVQDLLAIFVPAGEETPRGDVSTRSLPQPVALINNVPADLILGADRGLLVPQRNPTTLPRGTILTLRLAGGDVGVARASRGSESRKHVLKWTR